MRGIIPPMLTPLTEQSQIDGGALHRLVEHLISGGVNGIFVLGTTGEGAWLTDSQCRIVVRETVNAVKGRVPVLVGLLQPSTPRILDMLDWVQTSDADAVVVTTPYYYEAGTSTQLTHMRTVARASALPVVIYNIPSKTYSPLQLEVIERLLDETNIVAFKDSSGDFAYFSEALRLCRRRPNFRILQGSEQQAMDALRYQADGIVSGLSNLVPSVFVQMLADAQSGQFVQAETLQARINVLWELHNHAYWLSALKYAASVLGLCSPVTVGHHTPVEAAAQRAIEQTIDQSGVL